MERSRTQGPARRDLCGVSPLEGGAKGLEQEGVLPPFYGTTGKGRWGYPSLALNKIPVPGPPVFNTFHSSRPYFPQEPGQCWRIQSPAEPQALSLVCNQKQGSSEPSLPWPVPGLPLSCTAEPGPARARHANTAGKTMVISGHIPASAYRPLTAHHLMPASVPAGACVTTRGTSVHGVCPPSRCCPHHNVSEAKQRDL